LVTKVHIALQATHAALPILTLKFPPKKQHSKSYHNFTIQQPSKRKIQNSHQMPNLLHVYHNETIHLPSLFRSHYSTLPPSCLPFPKGRAGTAPVMNVLYLTVSLTSSHQTNQFSLQKFKIRHTDTSLSSAHLKTQ